MAALNIFLLGSPRIELDGKPVALERNKALALMAYLAMEGSAQARETLAALLWPEYDHEHAYAYLRRTLWAINAALGDGWLAAGRDQIALPPSPGLRLDAAFFREALEECSQHDHPVDHVCERCIQPLEQAVDFYRGDFMAGFSLRDSAAFDEWQLFQSDKLKNELAGALQRLARAYSSKSDPNRAIQAARRWLALDLLNEAAHRQLMTIYAQSGQRNAALRQYQECLHILSDELGVAPQLETTRLYESIKAGELVASGAARTNRQTPTLIQQPNRLPSPATPFVGRVQELAEIAALLQNPECRLLTVVGPGGIGKTRLSIQAAAQLVSQQYSGFADGVVFVSLAPVNSAQWLVPAIASGLMLQFRSEQMQRDAPESQKVQLIEYLRDRRLLLALDNFEQLISGADLLAEILAASPGVKMLVTSRERLRLAAEWVFEVGGMSFPPNGGLESLETYSAVQLFIQNARRARASFTVSEADKASIARICRLVEGVPLAIELAAAWVKLLSGDEIAAEIERSLDFLTSDLRGVPERHHSLRAVFEHSWRLLAPAEQDALMRLSVFRSHFRRDAGAAVVNGLQIDDQGGSEAPARPPALDGRSSTNFLLLLSALVDKSLLRRMENTGQEARFGMHELIRQYAAEKLDQTPGAAEQSRRRHSAYYAAWLEKMFNEMRTPRQIQALNQVELEIEDVRAAWRWLIARQDYPELLQFISGLFQYYNIRNRQQEAEEDFRQALESLPEASDQPGGQAQRARAYLLTYYCSALFNADKYDQAYRIYPQAVELAAQANETDQATLHTLLSFGSGLLPPEQVEQHYRQSQQIFERAGDRWSAAMAMLIYASYAQYTLVDMALARQLCQESLDLFRELGDRVGMVFSLNNQASLCYALGEYETVKRLSDESLVLCRALGDRWRVAAALLILGQACVALGEYSQARQVYQEAVQLMRELGNRRVIARYLACLGYVVYLEGELGRAQELFLEALELSRQIGDRREMGMSNMNLGNIALSSGDPAEARQFYLAAIELLDNIPFAGWEFSICLKRMGSLCFQLGEVTQAGEYYRRALAISQQLKRTPEILDNLVGIAELLGFEGQHAQAVELVALALAHEECASDVRARAETLLSDYQAALPAAVFEIAVRDGKVKLLESALSDL